MGSSRGGRSSTSPACRAGGSPQTPSTNDAARADRLGGSCAGAKARWRIAEDAGLSRCPALEAGRLGRAGRAGARERLRLVAKGRAREHLHSEKVRPDIRPQLREFFAGVRGGVSEDRVGGGRGARTTRAHDGGGVSRGSPSRSPRLHRKSPGTGKMSRMEMEQESRCVCRMRQAGRGR